MPEIPTIYQNHETGWSNWFSDGKAFTIVCCDCALTHDFEIRKRNGRYEYRIRVDKRATSALRRFMNKFLKLRD